QTKNRWRCAAAGTEARSRATCLSLVPFLLPELGPEVVGSQKDRQPDHDLEVDAGNPHRQNAQIDHEDGESQQGKNFSVSHRVLLSVRTSVAAASRLSAERCRSAPDT